MFQDKKPKEHISTDSVYGAKCLLHVTNIILIGIVIILIIVSTCIYYIMPVMDVTKLVEKTDDIERVDLIEQETEPVDTVSGNEDEPEDEFYNIIATKNVFSPQRKDWVIKEVITKASEFANKSQNKSTQNIKKAFTGNPKKFILHGILISGDIKKALIDNPLKGVRTDKTLYVEVGEDLDGYKVKSIEKDRIKLDWYGEEIVVLLYSGVKGYDESQNEKNDVERPEKMMKKLKVNKGDISSKPQNEVNDSFVTSVFDAKVSKNEDGPYVASVFDEVPIYPMSKTYESFFMLVTGDKKISGSYDIQEDDKVLHKTDIISSNASRMVQEIDNLEVSEHIKTEKPEEDLNQKSIFKKTTEIKLHGIFIVDGIKKAMIENQLKGTDPKHALCVKEGDFIKGFKVESIEKDRIKLDCQGEKSLVVLSSSIMDCKLDDCAAEEVSNKTMEIMETNERCVPEKDKRELESSRVASAVGGELREEGNPIITSVFEEEEFSPMAMAYESMFTPVMDDVKISGQGDDMHKVEEILHDVEIDNIEHTGEEQKIAMIEPSDSVYSVLEGEELKQNSLYEVPAQIILKGIVIAGNIKKALVNVPMSEVSGIKSLFVEEGDGLEGYLVTKIEPEQIRLDWQGEEKVVTFPGLY